LATLTNVNVNTLVANLLGGYGIAWVGAACKKNKDGGILPQFQWKSTGAVVDNG
jgi:hypothetical protein